MMKPWNRRSDIEASLFNPAFCGELIFRVVSSYNKTSKQGKFPYALSYLVLPFLMNAVIYGALPKTRRTSFISWLFTNRHLTPLIANKAKEMKNYTKEAVLFYLSKGLLQIDNQAELEVGERKLMRKRNFQRDEVEMLLKRADFIGEWFCNVGDVVTFFSLIGITV